ncbi:hypothetical protein [Kamptonema sp. UHCC 0994]|uniref:hypothetical protein n=1 Tax=Kamptonema sp. UHCC 0994 TaxID=3031329 RepID=UPI0023BA19BE|nr:hypothetical protein [Kamptonema sp. UHCC 0994]MDF0551681.1 hypothetical protein [Kamptonema sp. UHCC 0994]
MDKGIDKQVQLFTQDYEDGEAIAQRYLKILARPAYLTRKQSFHKRGGSHSKSKDTHNRNDGRTQRLDGRNNHDSMD